MARLFSDDFREFLKLCTRKRVKYLLIGGYAVCYYGHPRFTADMDVWIEATPGNAARMVQVLEEFGFGQEDLTPETLLSPGTIIRMGRAPLRLEILNEIDGVSFEECYPAKESVMIDGIRVQLISLKHLRINKKAAGRLKDLDDLERLKDVENES